VGWLRWVSWSTGAPTDDPTVMRYEILSVLRIGSG
jgi:hypothetical protein